MWESLLELAAGMFGVTVRSRLGQLVLFCAALFVLGVTLGVRWGLVGLGVPAVFLALAVAGARQVMAARDAVWRAACLPLDAPRQVPPSPRGRVLALTTSTLLRLAAAVDRTRRGRFAEARELIASVRAYLLRPEEARLVGAVRLALVAELAPADCDTAPGRALLAEAWGEPDMLRAIHAAWARAGVSEGPLARMAALTRVRIDTRVLEQVAAPEARDLAEEARALGDEALAAELDERGRSTAYR